jgi:hypothetical protein
MISVGGSNFRESYVKLSHSSLPFHFPSRLRNRPDGPRPQKEKEGEDADFTELEGIKTITELKGIKMVGHVLLVHSALL